jgi:hydrogenase maturation factor
MQFAYCNKVYITTDFIMHYVCNPKINTMKNMVTRESIWHNAIGSRNTYGIVTADTKRYTALKDFTLGTVTGPDPSVPLLPSQIPWLPQVNIKKGDILNLEKRPGEPGASWLMYRIQLNSPTGIQSRWFNLSYAKEIVPAVSFAARTTLIN